MRIQNILIISQMAFLLFSASGPEALAASAVPIDRSPIPSPDYLLSMDRVSFLLVNRLIGDELSRSPGQVSYTVDVSVERANEKPVWRWAVPEPVFRQLQSLAGLRSKVLLEKGADQLSAAERSEIAGLSELLRRFDGVVPKYPRAGIRADLRHGTVRGDEFEVGAGSDRALLIDGKVWEVVRSGDTEGLLSPTMHTFPNILDGVEVEVIARGFLPAPGRFVLEHIVPISPQTLDVFLMSHCPFAQERIAPLAAVMQVSPPDLTVRVHYILYEEDGEITSMHGPAETAENALQMRVREISPNVFFDFVVERLRNPAEDWIDAAQVVGLSEEDVTRVRDMGATDSERLRAEIHFVRDQNAVFDGSPRFFWEGVETPLEQIGVLRELGFNPSDATDEICTR